MTTRTWALCPTGTVTDGVPSTAAIVLDLIVLPTGTVPGADLFPAAMATNMVDVTDATGIAQKWTYAGGAWAAPSSRAAPPPTLTQLLTAASAAQNQALQRVWTFQVGTTDAPLAVTTTLGVGGQTSMLKLLLWGQMNLGTDATEPYSNVDYSTATLSPAQAISLAQQAGAIVSQSYGALNVVAQAINATPPTITTLAQVSAATWPSPGA